MQDHPADHSGKENDSQRRLPSRSDRDQALAALLRRDDVVLSAELTRLGFSEREIRTRIEHGQLRRLHRGVFVAGQTRHSGWVYLKAAALAVVGDAFLSHRTAAAARHYRAINIRDIHVSVVAGHTPRRPGMTVHRTAPPAPGEVTLVSGIRVATAPRILVDLAASGAPARELDELITAAERRGALGGMEEALARHARRPGIARLRAALEGHLSTPAYNSTLEADFWAWYATQPDLPPPDATNIIIGSHEYDGIWRDARLVLEIDSRDYHQARADMENDRRKDIAVQRLGLRIIRITDLRFAHDRAGIRADLLAFLAVAA